MKALITPAQARKLLERRRKDKFEVSSLFDPNFPQQKAFIDDPARLKALFCTRRAAKSYTAGLYMVHEALTHPGCNCLFIGLTRESAKAIILKDILKPILVKNNIKARINLTELVITFQNGSTIKIVGVDAEQSDMLKRLGTKLRLVCIDEASMYTVNVRNLVYGILGPAMIDEQGTICLSGTASNFTRGLFYDITTGSEPGWSVHKWTAHENPYVSAKFKNDLELIARDRPLYMETPHYKQWFLNQWVVDNDKKVYKFDETRNLYEKLPAVKTGWTYTLGVDTGWEDDNAFVLVGYQENDPNLYVMKTFNKKHMTFDQVVLKIEEFMKDKDFCPSKVVIDGANKQGVESMRQRSAIPFEYADKQDKNTFIEILNADLVQAKIKIQAGLRPLIDEMMSLVWKTLFDGDEEKIIVPKREHPALPNHMCFVAGTLVETDTGTKPIELITFKDHILTRHGYRPVKRIGSTGLQDTVRLTFSNGRALICTENHPFYTKNRGFVCAANLTTEDKLFPIEELNFTGIQTPEEDPIDFITTPQLTALGRVFIALHMKWKSDLYLKAGTFITKTDTMTTQPGHLKPCQSKNIVRNIQNIPVLKSILNIWKKYDLLQPFGILLQKVVNGIVNTLYLKNQELNKKQFVPFAGQTMTALHQPTEINSFVHLDVTQKIDGTQDLTTRQEVAHGVQKSFQPTNIQNKDFVVVLVTRETQTQKEVFNLEVERDHEYFANGILVSNCDALLYAWRNSYHYHHSTLEPVLVKGSKQWYEKQAEEIWEREREHLENLEKGNDDVNWHGTYKE